MESNVAFTDAVARARQIAAKLGTATPASGPAVGGIPTINPLTGGLPDKGNPNNMPLGTKRAFPGGDGDDSGPKRMAGGAEPDPITAQLRALADQQRTSAKDMAKMAAEQVAAKLSGVAPAGGNMAAPMMGGAVPGGMGGGPHAGLGLMQTEEWSIPNRMVGLVIGSKGENITQIQAQSGCRIQIAPDPANGNPNGERHVTLNGPAEAIQKAKELINGTMNESEGAMMGGRRGGAGGPDMSMSAGGAVVEVMIPANKVGLIIGKGGETIKNLQMQSGCKMVMVQDGPFQNAPEKPLKISGGDQGQVENGKRIVEELLASKDGGRGYEDHGNGYGGGGGGSTESLPVPREAVGIIIGKGGEQIKNIQAKFNVRIQFQNDDGGSQRMCDITGVADAMYAAKQHIQELIQENANRGGRGGPRGGGRDFGDRGGPPRGGPRDGGFGGSRGPGGPGEETAVMRVPSERCGIVIGKGGENIRTICQMSGAHVELNRNAPQNMPEKEFTIRGTPDQIQHAMHLIGEKANVPPPGQGRGPHGGPGGHGGAAPGGPHGGPGGWGGPAQNGGPGGHYGGGGYPSGGPGGYPGQHGAGPQHHPGQHGGPQQGGAGPQQPWGNYNYNQWGQAAAAAQGGAQAQQHSQGGAAAAGQAPGAATGQTPGGDPSQQGQEQAAWQAYYAQYYGQYQQQQAVAAVAGQPAAPGTQPTTPAAQPGQQAAAVAAQQAAAAQPKMNPATGQPDYSEQWAAYYRQMGWHEQADSILKNAANGGGAGQTQTSQAQQ